MRKTILCTAVVVSTGFSALFSAAGLIGFGSDTRWGAGGTILRVTSLEGKGAGTLRAALESKGPRTIVFEVGGVIDLGAKAITVKEPFVTIAGQTAPSPGITVIKGAIYIATHDVIVQHIRVRPGDCGLPKKSGFEPDAISTSAAYNVVVDHCSTTWAVDENLSASGPRTEGPEATSRKITFSNCIIAEGLRSATHAKGNHSMGSLIHDYCTDIAVIGNLYACNNARNPYFKAFCTGVIVNNVISNPGAQAIQLNYSEAEFKEANIKPQNCRVAIVGNVLYHGQDTKRGLAMIASKGSAYMQDNAAFDKEGKPAPLTGGNIEELKEKPVWPNGLTALASKDVAEQVLKHAGARPRERDAIDQRIIRNVQQRTGKIIDSQEEVGGYPHQEMTRRKLEVPEKDVEAWLAKLAGELE